MDRETSRTEVQGRTVILLNGARRERQTGRALEIVAPDALADAVRRDPDAVAFGYVRAARRWVAAA